MLKATHNKAMRAKQTEIDTLKTRLAESRSAFKIVEDTNMDLRKELHEAKRNDTPRDPVTGRFTKLTAGQ